MRATLWIGLAVLLAGPPLVDADHRSEQVRSTVGLAFGDRPAAGESVLLSCALAPGQSCDHWRFPPRQNDRPGLRVSSCPEEWMPDHCSLASGRLEIVVEFGHSIHEREVTFLAGAIVEEVHGGDPIPEKTGDWTLLRAEFHPTDATTGGPPLPRLYVWSTAESP